MDRIDVPRLMLSIMLSILIVVGTGSFVVFFPKLFLIMLTSAAVGMAIVSFVAIVYFALEKDDVA